MTFAFTTLSAKNIKEREANISWYICSLQLLGTLYTFHHKAGSYLLTSCTLYIFVLDFYSYYWLINNEIIFITFSKTIYSWGEALSETNKQSVATDWHTMGQNRQEVNQLVLHMGHTGYHRCLANWAHMALGTDNFVLFRRIINVPRIQNLNSFESPVQTVASIPPDSLCPFIKSSE